MTERKRLAVRTAPDGADPRHPDPGAVRTAALETVLATLRGDATWLTLDLPVQPTWPDDAVAAAAVLRRTARVEEPGTLSSYGRVDDLAVDDGVWAAYRRVVARVHESTVRAGDGSLLLRVADAGTAVEVWVTPEQEAVLADRLPPGALEDEPAPEPTLADRLAALVRRGRPAR